MKNKTFDESKAFLQTKNSNGLIHESVVYTEISKLYSSFYDVMSQNKKLLKELEHYKMLMHWHGKVVPITPPSVSDIDIKDIYRSYNKDFHSIDSSEDSFKYQWYRVIDGEIKEWTVCKYTCAEMELEPYNSQDWFKVEGTRELQFDVDFSLHQKIEQHLLHQMDCPTVATHKEVVERIKTKHEE